MNHSPHIVFEFTPAVFLLNFTISLLIGLVMALYRWEAGVGTAPAIFVLLYTAEGKPVCQLVCLSSLFYCCGQPFEGT